MARKKKAETGTWNVRMEVTRIVEVTCEGCTEQEAWDNPWEYVVGEELDVDQRDWEVEEVRRIE